MAGFGALITGDIYGSGAGVVKGNTITYETNENAYFKGQGEILINEEAVVQGSVYGGGKGVAENGYDVHSVAKWIEGYYLSKTNGE